MPEKKFNAHRHHLLLLALVAATYTITAHVVLEFFSSNGIVSVFWPSSGIAVAALLMAGRQLWPAITVGALSVNLLSGSSLMVSSLIAAGNTLEALTALTLLNRLKSFNPHLLSTRDYFTFIIVGGALSSIVSAVIGSTTLLIFDVIPPELYITNLLQWWMGDSLGIIMLAPLFLVWPQSLGPWLNKASATQAIILFGSTFIAGQIVFLDWFNDTFGLINRGYWMFIFVTLIALPFGRHGVTAMTNIIAIQALAGAISHKGFFADDMSLTSLSNFWLYMVTITIVGMAQAMAIKDRKKEAQYDPLTQLPSRRLFQDRLNQQILECRRENTGLALLFIDLDRFKEINDTLGHQVGDELLIQASQRISECVRATDTVARLGGDEFTVIISHLKHRQHLERVVNALIQDLNAPFIINDESIYTSASIGITLYPDDATSPEGLLMCADQAMYAAKHSGRNCFHYFTSSMQQRADQHMRLASDMRHALSSGQFQVYYQPIVDTSSGKARKAEALLRWEHPELGFISPAVFIPIAEDTGLINELGYWVFVRAAEQATFWSELTGKHFQISVNISPIQFMSPQGVSRILDFLQQSELNASHIVVELTEGVLLDDRREVEQTLEQFRSMGAEIAIDDFGTGYSSLSYLQKFPIDYVKIDQSFIRNLDIEANTQTLAMAVIAMTQALGLKTIAEGVEADKQQEFLQVVGCDYLQGFLFSKAISETDFTHYLKQQEKSDIQTE